LEQVAWFCEATGSNSVPDRSRFRFPPSATCHYDDMRDAKGLKAYV
jgi:hypothetical protein